MQFGQCMTYCVQLYGRKLCICVLDVNGWIATSRCEFPSSNGARASILFVSPTSFGRTNWIWDGYAAHVHGGQRGEPWRQEQGLVLEIVPQELGLPEDLLLETEYPW
jgi:hypothetical protein